MIHRLHLVALLRKEVQQIKTDKSVLVVAFIIPLILVLLYGYALRMDIKPVETVLVTPQYDDRLSKEIAFALAGSEYFQLSVVNNEYDAESLLRNHDVSAKVSLPPRLSSLLQYNTGSILISVNSDDAQQAKLAATYLSAVINHTLQSYLKKNLNFTSPAPAPVGVTLLSRNWFNERNNSTWYLMAGQFIGIITLMSAFMTSIVIAREYERGTMEGLLATNVSASTFLLSKIIPYYVLSVLGSLFTLLLSLVLFQLPLRGSILLYSLTLLVYLYVSLLIGLVISTATKNQFLSSEYAVILSFLPSILLSGALFDLRSIPSAISALAHIFPPTYAVESSKICMLSGGSIDILIRNLGILSLFGIVLTFLCYTLLRSSFKKAKSHTFR